MTHTEIAIILTAVIIPLGLSFYVIIKANKGIDKPIQKQAAIIIGVIQGVLNLSRALLYIDKISSWQIAYYLFVILSIGTIILVALLNKISRQLIKKHYEKT